MSFKDYISEAAEKHGVLAYGRMNPPTAGHEQVINKVHEVAKEHNAVHSVVLSHSQDKSKNPLPADVKVKHAKNAFPGTNIKAATKEQPTILHHASEMHKQGVRHLHVVAGSDRKEEYHKLLHKYNTGEPSKHGAYKFKSITVHSSGERDPDSEGTKGVSGTKMREHAATGNMKKFHAGLPSGMKPEHKEALYNDLRHHMESNEIYDPHLKVSKYQWGEKEGVDKMKKTTPGESLYKFKNKLKEQKIPFLLMSPDQRRQFNEESTELEFDGIQTKNFEICPSAYAAFKALILKINSLAPPQKGNNTQTLRHMNNRYYLEK